MSRNHILATPLAVATAMTLAACSAGEITDTASSTVTTPTSASASIVAALQCRESGVNTNPYKVANALAANTADHEVASDYTWTASAAVPIALNGTSISVSGSGATASGGTVTITAAGTYSISGSLTNGQVVVNTSDTGVVRLVLNGATIANSGNAAIVSTKAKKTVIMLADGTVNRVTDGTTYPTGIDPNAAIWSKSNLSIGGSGTLIVTGNFKDAIGSKDGLVIAQWRHYRHRKG